MGTSALTLMGLGSILGIGTSYNNAKLQKTQLGVQADIARLNAGLAEKSAQGALARGEREQQAARLSTAQLKSRQRATLAANGVDLGVGSAANILDSTDLLGEVDANTIAANAVRSAWGYRLQSTSLENQANIADATAGSISPTAAAFTSLLGSGAQVASSWYTMDQAGMFDSGSGTKWQNTSSSSVSRG